MLEQEDLDSFIPLYSVLRTEISPRSPDVDSTNKDRLGACSFASYPTNLAFDADFSSVKNYLRQLRSTGVEDFWIFFEEHPEELIDCIKRITCPDGNEGCLQLFGCAEQDKTDTFFHSFFTLEFLPVFRDLLVALADGNDVFEAEVPIHCKNRKQKKIQIRCTILPQNQETLARVHFSCIELTHKTHITHDITKTWTFLDTLIRTVHSPIIAWDQSCTISLINKAASLLIGIPPEQAVGQNIDTIFPEHNRKQSLQLIQGAKTEGSEEMMVPILQKSGDTRSIVWNSVHMTGPSDEVLATVAFGQDVTEQTWALEYLKRYISELTDKNNELMVVKDKLEKVNQNLDTIVQKRTQEVEELLRQKDEFITQIGHDLKTPLTPIIAILPILKKREQDPKKIEYLDMAIRNASQVHNLLLSILQMAHLNKTCLPALGTQIPISHMIDELIINFEFDALKKHLMVKNQIPEDLGIRINPIDFDTIFGNILDNAIKFSKPNGEITFCGERTGEGIIIEIKDTGIGLLPEETSHIFEEFYKADNSRHDGRSYGLGLSIAQKIVERNGGKILVNSEGKDAGTVFSLIFPHQRE